MSRRPDDGERDLFRAHVGDVRRLRDDRHRAAPDRPPPRPRAHGPAQEPDESGLSEHPPGLDLEAGDVLAFARPGLQHRLLRRLRRGQIPVDGELDLHGRTVNDARAALAGFLAYAAEHRWRGVRLVHGKGRGSPGRRSVLKAHLDRWLRQRPEVLAFCAARPEDGGTGALYVLLRREHP